MNLRTQITDLRRKLNVLTMDAKGKTTDTVYRALQKALDKLDEAREALAEEKV